ncbi:hypothetical protein [Georgenia sp. SUBG003]|uniref:hypothetical protein n=1 Tax=Georgenia sp. SUBG003 TaxID=1497974 RepID=UPI003AB46DC0
MPGGGGGARAGDLLRARGGDRRARAAAEQVWDRIADELGLAEEGLPFLHFREKGRSPREGFTDHHEPVENIDRSEELA